MAERRMFHTTVVESDAFLDLPLQTQTLYFHLGMHADDDGFINSPKQIARKLHTPAARLQQLVDAGFLLEVDGVVVLRHWRVANTLRRARLKPLQYPEIARNIYIHSNGVYSFSPEENSITLVEERMSYGCPMDVRWMPNRTEENRTEENITEMNINESKVTHPSNESDGTAAADSDMIKDNLEKGVIRLTPEQVRTLVDKIGLDYFTYYVEKLAGFIQDNNANVKNHYATIFKWWREDKK